MRIRLNGDDVSRNKVDLAVCFAHEGDRQPRGLKNPDLRRALAARMNSEKFPAQPGDLLVWNGEGQFGPSRFLILGLGAAASAESVDSTRIGAARAAREAGRFFARSLALQVALEGPGVGEHARAAVEGVMSGAYAFDRHLTDPSRRNVRLESLELSASGGAAALKRAVARGEAVARAVWLARDLVNEGPSRMTPLAMARASRAAARKHGLTCQVWGVQELRKKKMHALLEVSRGSQAVPQVVQLSYKPPRRSKKKIVLVGKGVTFDSGGLNLKPGEHMLHMKSDMAGAAAVLATMTTLGDLGCSLEVHALLGLVENMTGANAYKPGDIIDTLHGKTVEIGNTDAEGRLVLCDLLAYAEAKLKPTQIVDVATLTGACVVALGTNASGLFTRHEDLEESLLAAAAGSGEKLWPLPMYDDYLPLIQTGPADLRNVGGRWGGAITAALFLGEFLSRELPWAHIDIAGPGFNESESPVLPLGGTGAAVPTLARWLESS